MAGYASRPSVIFVFGFFFQQTRENWLPNQPVLLDGPTHTHSHIDI